MKQVGSNQQFESQLLDASDKNKRLQNEVRTPVGHVREWFPLNKKNIILIHENDIQAMELGYGISTALCLFTTFRHLGES